MTVAGFVRLRRHLFGRQAAFGAKVGASRAYPFKGVPSVELNWTDPDVDAGSIDPVAAPFRTGADLTASLDVPTLYYNDLPLLLSGFFGGDVAGSGGPDYAWAYDPASTTSDIIDTFTYQFGDDVLTDWYQLGDGIIETLEITGPDGLGACTATMSWRFGSVASTGSTDSPVSGSVPEVLTVDTAGIPVYLKDAALYIDTVYANLATGQISDALHTFTIRLSREVDLKRYANGDQTFDIDAYGVGARSIELECTFAKTADTVGVGSESDAWMSDEAVNRFARITFTSTAMADGATPYSWTFELPMRYYTRVEGEIGGNTTVILTGHAFYEPNDLGGVFKSDIVNTLANLDGTAS